MSFLGNEFTKNALRALIEAIFPPSESEMVVRKTTRDEVARRLSPISVRISGIGATIEVTALLPYRIPLIQTLVTEAKFEKNQRAQELLGFILAEYIRVHLNRAESFGEIVLVPLPLGSKRRKERGYNQSERIAYFALRELHLNTQVFHITLASHLLMRTRDTSPQTELGRTARLQNMRGAFGAPHVLDPALTYLLLDDVVTTGATLSAAHGALTQAGAKHIITLALAH